MFGIPMTGADVCGYGGVNPTEELCAKWMQLGTLYPFARQHSHISNSRKEPWQFGDTMSTTSHKSLAFRYKLLKYYYSLFIESHGKGTIFKPVFFEFSHDNILIDEQKVYDHQFMIGTQLLVIPNVEEGKDVISGYFPRSNWFDLRNDEMFGYGVRNINAGLNATAPVFLREGKTIFMQNVDSVENSYDLRDDVELVVALSGREHHQNSEGLIPALNDYNNKLHVDNCMKNDCSIKVHTSYDTNTKELKVKLHKPNHAEGDFTPLKLTKIKVFGIEDVAQFNNHFTSKLKNYNKHFVEKVKAKTRNDHTIEFKFGHSILFGKNDVEIVIQFI